MACKGSTSTAHPAPLGTIWTPATLGEVLPLTYGKAKTADAGYSRPATACFGSNGPFGIVGKALTSGPTLIIGRKGAAGVVHYSPDPCWPTDTAYYTTGTDKTYLPFFRYLLETLRLDSFDRSTAIPSLSRDDYNSISISYPKSLDIQRRIVEEIETQLSRLETGVEALRRAQANLKHFRAAVLKAACEGRLVPTEGLQFQQLGNLIVSIDQGWSPKCDREPAGGDAEWAVMTTTAIQALKFLDGENKRLPGELSPRPKLELRSGDLLVTRAGPRTRVGVTCLIRQTRPRLMLCDKAYRLRINPHAVNPEFLELVLNAPKTLDKINELKTGISDSGVNLTQSRFSKLFVPIPAIQEQARIVAEVERRLSVADALEATLNANLHRAARLRQSVLQAAFSGTMRHRDIG